MFAVLKANRPLTKIAGMAGKRSPRLPTRAEVLADVAPAHQLPPDNISQQGRVLDSDLDATGAGHANARRGPKALPEPEMSPRGKFAEATIEGLMGSAYGPGADRSFTGYDRLTTLAEAFKGRMRSYNAGWG